MRLSHNKPPGHQSSRGFSGWHYLAPAVTPHCWENSVHPYATVLGWDTWQPAPGFSWTWPHARFPSDDARLYLLTVKVANLAASLSLACPSWGSSGLGGGLGEPQHSVTPVTNPTVKLKEGRVCRVPRAQLRVPHRGAGAGGRDLRTPSRPTLELTFPTTR